MHELNVYYRAYREYLDRMQTDAAHTALMKALLADANASEGFQGRASQCNWDTDWINAMMDALPYVERAVAEQRKFIVSHEEIRRIDQAKKTSVESVRHLAQHSNMISNVSGDEIIPDRVLIVERDDNYFIYENRFLYTLVLRMQSFLDERLRAIAELNDSIVQSVFINRRATWNRKHLEASVRLQFEQKPTKLRYDVDLSEMSAQERVNHLSGRINDLTGAPLMQLLKGATQVSSPIVRTNVFKKNVNFKRALELFEFLEGYHKTGYEIVCDEPETQRLSAEFCNDLCESIAFESFILRLNAQTEIRQQLEVDFQKENELAEQERIRLEEERERAVQARIEEARAEEIAIRECEIAKREKELADLREKLRTEAAEVCSLKAKFETASKQHVEEMKALKQKQTQELDHVHAECAESISKITCERDELQRALDVERKRMQKECVSRLEEQRTMLQTKFERSLSKERSNAQRQFERQEKNWNARLRKQKDDMDRIAGKMLQRQRDESDKKLALMQRDLQLYKAKLEICENEMIQKEGNMQSRFCKFLKR